MLQKYPGPKIDKNIIDLKYPGVKYPHTKISCKKYPNSHAPSQNNEIISPPQVKSNIDF